MSRKPPTKRIVWGLILSLLNLLLASTPSGMALARPLHSGAAAMVQLSMADQGGCHHADATALSKSAPVQSCDEQGCDGACPLCQHALPALPSVSTTPQADWTAYHERHTTRLASRSLDPDLRPPRSLRS